MTYTSVCTLSLMQRWSNNMCSIILYLLSIAAITNHHILSSLNNTNLLSYNSGGKKSKMSLPGLK